MSKHFNLMEFLRKVPQDLLQTYCTREGILNGFSWGKWKKADAEEIAKALTAESKEVADRVMIHFRTLWDMSGRGFTYGALNEAKHWKDDDATAAINQLNSHLGKVFWKTLERPQFVKNAKILSEVDTLPEGAWVKRGGLPARPGPVDETMVAKLEASLIELFQSTEYRGSNCKIDPIRRGPEEIFFAYAEDHPDTEMVWQGSLLEPQVFNPAFRLIFKHNNEKGTLDIHVAGDRRKVPKLQQVFAKAVLDEEIPELASRDSVIYAINRVLTDGFAFEYSPDLGISDVRVVKVRFLLEGEPWRRFLVEADNAKVRDALTSLLGNMTKELPKGRLRLDQIHLKVSFEKQAEERRGKIRDCIITSPNVLRLKKDDLGERIEEMLVQSGIERRYDDEGVVTPPYRAILVALLSRVAERGGRPDAIFVANEVSQWPRGADHALMNARLLRELTPADSVTCFACEEQCRRPVASATNDGGRPQRVTWTCHLYDCLGPFDGPFEILRRLRSSREMVAKFLGRALKLEVRDHDANWRRISFATLKIKSASRAFRAEFDGNALVKVGSISIDLVELLEWDADISIDREALTAYFNASDDPQSGGKRVQASITVREDAKLSTQLRNRRLQDRINTLSGQYPDLSKEQLAKKLAKSGKGEGVNAGRIARVTRLSKKLGRKSFA